MENILTALDISAGIILFCLGMTLLIFMNKLYGEEYINLSNCILDNHFIYMENSNE